MGQDAVAWAESEFRGTPGLNARFQARLVRTAGALATRPQGTLPHRFDWAELKGAYRLVHAVANPDAVQAVHRQRTRERVAAVRTPVLMIHDGTQLDFSGHPAVADQLGPIGDGAEYARGFVQHNSLAVDPTGSQLLGLIHQQTFLRKPRPAGETRAERYQRTDRESAAWTRGIAAVGRPAAGQVWVHVGDRGADFFGAMATARAHGTHFLFRLTHDRKAQLVSPANAAKRSSSLRRTPRTPRTRTPRTRTPRTRTPRTRTPRTRRPIFCRRPVGSRRRPRPRWKWPAAAAGLPAPRR